LSPEIEQVDGLAVTRWGDRAGPTVVLVHGTMDRSAAFRRTARKLEDFDVVMFDRRGYGQSRSAGLAPTMEDQLADLQAVIEWTGSAPLTLVGHSLGGLISLHLAIGHPELVASVGVWESPMPWLEWYATSPEARPIGRAAITEGPEAAEMFLRAMIGNRLWERMPEAMKDERRAESAALVADLTMCRRPEAKLEFDQVTAPVIVGTGSDSAPRFRQSAVTMRDNLPNAMMVEVAGAQHGVHLSHPDEFAAFVRATVARREPVG
jgi:pimeloyl-ACP methyl ester carboxylesterase